MKSLKFLTCGQQWPNKGGFVKNNKLWTWLKFRTCGRIILYQIVKNQDLTHVNHGTKSFRCH
jgi:hypothetical protein